MQWASVQNLGFEMQNIFLSYIQFKWHICFIPKERVNQHVSRLYWPPSHSFGPKVRDLDDSQRLRGPWLSLFVRHGV